jgi:hypothetical protein
MAFTDFKTLRETAKLIQSNLVRIAPVRTGNLRDKLRQYNTINRILGTTKKDKTSTKRYSITADFEIEYAPPGAKYGKFWNDPTVSKTVLRGKTKNIPYSINYAQKAFDETIDQQMAKIQDEIANDAADDIVKDLEKAIDNL